MDRSKLKDIIRTLEITLDTLKAEVYSDVESVSYTHLRAHETP